MGKSSAPSAPDPTATADAQIKVNQATINQLAQANHTNQTGPLGSLNWTQDPTTGQWTESTQFAPPIQDQLTQEITNQDLGLGTQGNAQARLINANYAGSPMSLAGLPGMVTSNQLEQPPMALGINPSGLPALQTSVTGAMDPAALNQQQNAVYGQMASRLDPQWSQAQEQLQSQLANQGVAQGSEAYNEAMDSFNRQKTDAYQTASNNAVSAGNALQNQLFGQGLQAGYFGDLAQNQAFNQLLQQAGFTNQAIGQNFGQNLQAGQFGNQARQQAMGELLTQRQEPINEINSLKGQGQMMAPSFQSPGQLIGPQGAPDMAQLAAQQYGGQLNAYNANVGQQNALLGDASGLISALLLSSSDAKEKIAELDSGDALQMLKRLPVDRWRYTWSEREHIGTYAENFHRETGLGDDKTIAVIDAIGLLTAAVKGLAAEVDAMKETKHVSD